MSKYREKIDHEELVEELDEKDIDLKSQVEEHEIMDWIFTQVDNEEDKKALSAFMEEMCKELQPAVDNFYSQLRIPGMADAYLDKLAKQMGVPIPPTEGSKD